MSIVNPPAESPPPSTPRPPLGLEFRVWWALILVCGLTTSVLDDAIFDDETIIAFFGAGVFIHLIVRLCSWPGEGAPSSRFVAILVSFASGVFLGGVLLFVSMLSVYLSGVGKPVNRFVLTLFFGAIVLLLARRPTRVHWNYVRLAVVGHLAVGIAVALTLFLLYTGPEDLSVYPPPLESPYRLPWQPGIRRLCLQGKPCHH